MPKEEKPKIYFGVKQTKKFYLPETGESQWIEHQKLNEGQRRAYEDTTSKEVSMNTQTQEVRMGMTIGSDRKVLFDTAVIGYKVLVEEEVNGVKETKELNGFNPTDWEIIRDTMPADVANALLEDIRDFNSWLKPVIDEDKKK